MQQIVIQMLRMPIYSVLSSKLESMFFIISYVYTIECSEIVKICQFVRNDER